MKRCVLFVLAAVVFVLASTTVGEAQVTSGTGAIGFNLDKYARLRVSEYPYAAATRHMNRVNPIVALNKNAVFDYNENANATAYLPKMILVAGADSAAQVVTDNKFAPIAPPNVRVEMTVYLWKNAKFLVYRYRVYNDSTVTAPLYISCFASPSIANTYDLHSVVYNAAKSTYYFSKTGSPVYVAQKLLNKSLYSLRLQDWADYSPADPASDAATDSSRFAMSSYAKFDTLLNAGPDGAAVSINAGLYNLAPKDSADVYFGIGIGASASEAIALMDSAQAKYGKLVTSVEKAAGVVPSQFALAQNYPNPFNPSTQIRFMLSGRSDVSLTVYDALGRNIRTLVNEHMDAGEYVTTFDATGLASGVYYYVLRTGSLVESKRMVLIR